MEQVKSWILQLVVIGLGGVIAGSLIRRESFQRYLKLVIGFLMIMVLIEPVIRLRDSDFDPAALIPSEIGGLGAETDSVAGQMRRVNEEWLNEYAVINLQSQIGADIRMTTGLDCRVDVRLASGGTGVEEVRIRVPKGCTEEDREWIVNRLAQNYGFSGSQIRIIGG